ncbi:hypothetical protein WG66_011698 [Moniliophthora roreri]|uniref:Uncharacterized protein n=1 Tax=Moniliophthora roreri TaxID=221103 RepID=A0A0W0G6U5_MONRR|nr:hypothetical protein WG66_011698 [Moniliophthora roreri]
MPPSSASLSVMSSPSSQRPRRPPSPVSMYVAGFGFDAPRPPKPLVKLDTKQKQKKANRQSLSRAKSPSNATASSPQHTESVVSRVSSAGSKDSEKSLGSKRSFSLSGWIKRTPSTKVTVEKTEALSSPAPFRSPKNQPSMDFVPSEAEVRVRQLDKVTRTLGERVPVEYILQGESHEESSLPSTPECESASEIMMRSTSLPPVTRDLPLIPGSSSRPDRPDEKISPTSTAKVSSASSPGSGNQEYHYTKRVRTLPPVPVIDIQPRNSFASDSESIRISPIIFSPPPDPPLPPPKQSITANSNDSTKPPVPAIKDVPLLLRIPDRSHLPLPRPKSSIHSHPRPTTSHGIPSAERTPSPKAIAFSRPSTSHGSSPTTERRFPDRADSPFQDSSIPLQAWLSASWSARKDGAVVRRERNEGWSGEWNRTDMQDVIQKLRHLK